MGVSVSRSRVPSPACLGRAYLPLDSAVAAAHLRHLPPGSEVQRQRSRYPGTRSWATGDWVSIPGAVRSIHSVEYQVVLSLLKELRQEAGLRQADLAAIVGRPQTFVSKYELGERRLDIIELRQLCIALGTSLPAFVGRLESVLNNDGRQ